MQPALLLNDFRVQEIFISNATLPPPVLLSFLHCCLCHFKLSINCSTLFKEKRLSKWEWSRSSELYSGFCIKMTGDVFSSREQDAWFCLGTTLCPVGPAIWFFGTGFIRAHCCTFYWYWFLATSANSLGAFLNPLRPSSVPLVCNPGWFLANE